MRGLIIRMAITALGLWVASELVGGISVADVPSLVWAALWLGIVNAIVRPVAIFLTLPITLLSLGLFLWVINAGMLALVAWLLDGFGVASFGAALMGALIVGLTGWLANGFIGPSGRYELVILQKR